VIISVRLLGLERLTRGLLDQATTLAHDHVNRSAADASSAVPLDPAPDLDPPPPNEVMPSTRRTNR
jgi:hypothetical protein